MWWTPDTRGDDSLRRVPPARFSDHKDYDNFSGLLGLNWQVADDALAWLVQSRVPSREVSTALPPRLGTARSHDEETLMPTNWALKATLADGSVRLRTAYFYHDYRQAGAGLRPGRGIRLARPDRQCRNPPFRARRRNWVTNASLYVSAGVAWLDSKSTSSTGYNSQGQYQDYPGQSSPNADWQFNATLNLPASADRIAGCHLRCRFQLRRRVLYGGLDDTGVGTTSMALPRGTGVPASAPATAVGRCCWCEQFQR